MQSITGLHHVTAIAGPAQENLDFYAGILGMRLVKKSVNQDDPGTYHLFYADAAGHPGTDLTFFPWSHMAPSRLGHGLGTEVQLTVPAGSLEYWGERLVKYGVKVGAIETRFGDRVLPLTDPHGLQVALVEAADTTTRGFEPWAHSPVPVERQVRGLHGARAWERDRAATGVVPDQRARLHRIRPANRAGRGTCWVTVVPGACSTSRRRQTCTVARGAPAASITSPGA